MVTSFHNPSLPSTSPSHEIAIYITFTWGDAFISEPEIAIYITFTRGDGFISQPEIAIFIAFTPVSYTHLTLPTTAEV